ncbi:MAG TPA: hypothetical protein VFF27_14180 [Bacteroidia bacterium]|jgi:hypothetical protein|nr:hypothetical protein [Bacteroidia bacterium]
MNINKDNYEAYFLDYHEGNLSPQQVADLFLFLSQHPELKKELDEFENIELSDFSTPVFENKESLKKNITPDNQEEYFIRAVEGTLGANELMLLNAYLTAHPEYLKEFNLFQQTKLQADPSLIFEDKNELKQVAEQDQVLIASVEGLLNKKEQGQLEQELKANTELKRNYTLYQHTKIAADTSIIFADKQILKRKERKVVPLFYYISAAAAAIAIILGLFFLFRTTSTFSTTDSNQIAHQQITPTVQPAIVLRPMAIESQTKTGITNTNTYSMKKNQHRQIVPKETKVAKTIENTNKLETAAIIKPSQEDNQTFVKRNTIIALDSNLNPDRTNTPVIAKIEKKPGQLKTPEFHSIQDLLASKLKEKLIGKEMMSQDKNNDKPAKINGWDIAGVFAKKLSTVTGKKIAVKPKYNKEGEVTAYALSAGKLEFSRIK